MVGAELEMEWLRERLSGLVLSFGWLELVPESGSESGPDVARRPERLSDRPLNIDNFREGDAAGTGGAGDRFSTTLRGGASTGRRVSAALPRTTSRGRMAAASPRGPPLEVAPLDGWLLPLTDMGASRSAVLEQAL